MELHQLRHAVATYLGEQKVPLQLIMAKTRHKPPSGICAAPDQMRNRHVCRHFKCEGAGSTAN
jgi:hypothetical protein